MGLDWAVMLMLMLMLRSNVQGRGACEAGARAEGEGELVKCQCQCQWCVLSMVVVVVVVVSSQQAIDVGCQGKCYLHSTGQSERATMVELIEMQAQARERAAMDDGAMEDEINLRDKPRGQGKPRLMIRRHRGWLASRCRGEVGVPRARV